MQYYYGEANWLRALDEAEFWKRQESEHITVLLTVVPNMEQQYVDILNEYQDSFEKTHNVLIGVVESVLRLVEKPPDPLKKEIIQLIEYSVTQSKDFVQFLENTLNTSPVLKNNVLGDEVFNHIIRESQYFIGIDQLALDQFQE